MNATIIVAKMEYSIGISRKKNYISFVFLNVWENWSEDGFPLEMLLISDSVISSVSEVCLKESIHSELDLVLILIWRTLKPLHSIRLNSCVNYCNVSTKSREAVP